jgi:hypothetical protein
VLVDVVDRLARLLQCLGVDLPRSIQDVDGLALTMDAIRDPEASTELPDLPWRVAVKVLIEAGG